MYWAGCWFGCLIGAVVQCGAISVWAGWGIIGVIGYILEKTKINLFNVQCSTIFTLRTTNTHKSAKHLAHMKYTTIAERLKLLTETKGTLSLAIEGQYTNLFIWLSDNVVYLRLDKHNAYSAPLSEESITYLRPNKPMLALLKYGFKTSADNLMDILTITSKMPYRFPREW